MHEIAVWSACRRASGTLAARPLTMPEFAGEDASARNYLGTRVCGREQGMAGSAGRLVVDIRAFDPALRRAMIFSVVDRMVEMDCRDELLLVTDHEPSGIGYQIDLRKETRGRFEFTYNQRSDGAWVALIASKRG